MSIITYPLNGITYDASDAETYLCTRTSGVYASDTMFAPSVTGDREVTISGGLAWINNADGKGKSVYVDEDVAVTVPIADGSLPRIDRIVLQFSATANASTIALIEGTPASSPEAPAITQTENLYQLGLCTIAVAAASVTVSAADITSTLTDEDVCGVMSDGVTKIPTATLYATYQAWYKNMQEESTTTFDEWFAALKEKFSDDIVSKLQTSIDTLTESTETNATNISTNASNIAENTKDISDLNTLVNARVPYSTATTASTNLDDYTSTGIYYFSSSYTPTNIPAGVNGWLLVMQGNNSTTVKQMWWRHGTIGTNDYNTWIRTRLSSGWSDWYRLAVIDDSASSTAKTYSSSQIDSLLDEKITEYSRPHLTAIELISDTPYIDFRFGSSSSDYTSRIIESSSGTLNIPGNLTVGGTFTNDALTVKSISDGTAFSTEEQTVTYDALVGKSYIDVYIQCSSVAYSRILRVYSGTCNGFVVYNASQYNLRGYVYFDSSSGEVKFMIDNITGFSASAWIFKTIYYTV